MRPEEVVPKHAATDAAAHLSRRTVALLMELCTKATGRSCTLRHRIKKRLNKKLSLSKITPKSPQKHKAHFFIFLGLKISGAFQQKIPRGIPALKYHKKTEGLILFLAFLIPLL